MSINGVKCATCGDVECVGANGWRCPHALIAVDASKLPEFMKSFGKLRARAAKLGCELPTYELVTDWSHVFFHSDAFGNKWTSGAHVKGVRVTGPRPKFAGWSLVAKLEPLGDINLIKSVPDAGELPASFRSGTQCEHCNKSRRRSETFVVRHEDGRMMRVGRQCIGDFLGGTSPANVALLFALAIDCGSFGGSDDEESGGWGCRAPSAWPLDTFVGLVIRDINTNGWLSRAQARDGFSPSTSDLAFQRMIGDKRNGKDPERPTTEELESARAAIEWAKSLKGASDFEHNIMAIARTDHVTMKTLGMAAAIYNAHQRCLEREVARREFARLNANSVHVGEVKQRLSFTLTVTAIYDSEGDYGCTHIHTMVDAHGNVFKWFASSERLTIGTAYNVVGTVKSHGEYKGRKETTLTRCRATEYEGL